MSSLKHPRKLQRIIDNMTLPRVQMFFILAFTGAIGFGSSVLLQPIVPSMALRYPLVILISYCVFLMFLRVWLSLHHNLGIDLEAIPIDGGWPVGSTTVEPQVIGGRGDFAGAGSGGQWADSTRISSGGSVGSSGGSANVDISGGLDLEDAWLVLLAIVAIVAALLAVFYVIYIAPVLLAEIFIDGAIVAGLYGSMRRVDQRHWLSTAVRKTIVPAVLTAILFGVAGFLFQKAIPEAHTIGQVWANLVS